jgi:hypothetical protein
MSRAETESHRADVTASDLVIRIVAPPVMAFVLLAGYVIAESLGFRGFARPEGDTAAEAAALGHAARTLELISEGQNPNEPLQVRSGFVDASNHDLRPLEAAILGRHVELARLLLRVGASRFDTSRAACFARARLPEVLPDLGAAPSRDSGTPSKIEAAIRMCAAG